MRDQLLTKPRGVRVGDLAEQQLGPDRDNLDPHRPAPFSSPAVASRRAERPSTYCTPVKTVRPAATHTANLQAVLTGQWSAPGTCRSPDPARASSPWPTRGPESTRRDGRPASGRRRDDLRAPISPTGAHGRSCSAARRTKTQHHHLVGERIEERPRTGRRPARGRATRRRRRCRRTATPTAAVDHVAPCGTITRRRPAPPADAAHRQHVARRRQGRRPERL